MNDIKITHELCAEDRKRIDDLTQALGYLAGLISQSIKGPAYTAKQPDPIDELPEEVKMTEAPTEEHPVENPFPEAINHTKDEVRKLVVTLSANGKKAEARDIVLAHGKSITDLQEEAINTVYNALKALEG